MDDISIIDLYFARNELAIKETDRKYHSYLYRIAHNILGSHEDSDESVNDTYYRTWENVPPDRPLVFKAYLAKIIRGISIDIYRRRFSAKRRGSEYSVSLEELDECVSHSDRTEREVDGRLLSDIVCKFINGMKHEKQEIFIERYYYLDPLSVIAERRSISAGKVKSVLFRIRAELKEYLIKEGYSI